MFHIETSNFWVAWLQKVLWQCIVSGRVKSFLQSPRRFTISANGAAVCASLFLYHLTMLPYDGHTALYLNTYLAIVMRQRSRVGLSFAARWLDQKSKITSEYLSHNNESFVYVLGESRCVGGFATLPFLIMQSHMTWSQWCFFLLFNAHAAELEKSIAAWKKKPQRVSNRRPRQQIKKFVQLATPW